jgi:VPDSG-CTERM motif
MNKFTMALVGSGLVFLFASLTQATSIGIDLGPSRVLTGVNPEAGPIGFDGLNGTPVTGSVSVDFVFTNNEFARIYTATQPLFDALITLQTSGSGLLGFLGGTGYPIDAHGNAIPGFGITGSASGNDASLSIGLFPLLKDKNGTPNDQLKRPFDFYGVHFDFTFPSNSSVEVTGGQFLLAGNGTFTPFAIGPGHIPADITVPDQGSTFLLLMLSLLGVATCRRLWVDAVC